MLVADGSYGDLYAIGVCLAILAIHRVSEHHKTELHLFFFGFDASLQPKCIQSTASSCV